MKTYNLKYTQDTDLAYAVGKIRALEKKMIGYNTFLQLTESSLTEIKRILEDSGYNGDDIEIAVEQDLKNNKKWISDILSRYEKYKGLKNLLLLYYDINNLKKKLKLKILEKKGNLQYELKFDNIGLLSEERMDLILKEKSFKSDYAKVIINYVKQALKIEDPATIENLMDKMFLEIVNETLNGLKIDFFSFYFKIYVDILNIKNIVRFKILQKDYEIFKKYYFDYGTIKISDIKGFYNKNLEEIIEIFRAKDFYYVIKEGIDFWFKKNEISFFDKLCDDYLTGIARQGKLLSFGVEPVICYLIGKLIEYKNILILINLKKLKYTPEKIKGVIRKTYA